MRIDKIISEIRRMSESLGKEIRLMEVCGTHTVAIFRHGLREVLPKNIKLLSGPGCPVCVTPIKDVDWAIELSRRENLTLTTFGDMMRVPGKRISLSEARAEGADIRVLYSPADALSLARGSHNEVVFFATGFETTSPLIAATLMEAEEKRIMNFSIYSAHKLVPPALRALLDSKEVMVDGFILPGHVSTVIGKEPYQFIPWEYGKPGVITGFEAEDILRGILMLLEQLVNENPTIEIQYTSAVRPEGNTKAMSLMARYFKTSDALWRGIGMINASGLELKEEYSGFDAKKRFDITIPDSAENPACSCGEILKGIKLPPECRLFGKACTPEKPVGACMVSTEGSCAAFYKYGNRNG